MDLFGRPGEAPMSRRTTQEVARRRRAGGIVAMLAVMAVGPAARGRSTGGALAPGDFVELPHGTKLRVGRQAFDKGEHLVFLVRKVQGQWLWVVSRDHKGWVKQGDVFPLARPVGRPERLR